MSKESERVYIEGRMATIFGSAHPEVPLGFQNSNFIEPKESLFVRFHIMGGKGVAIGGAGGFSVVTRYPGIVQATVWTPDESGMSLANKIIDNVKSIFEYHRGRDVEGDVITFKAAEFPNQAATHGWHPVIVKIPFYRDQVTPVG